MYTRASTRFSIRVDRYLYMHVHVGTCMRLRAIDMRPMRDGLGSKHNPIYPVTHDWPKRTCTYMYILDFVLFYGRVELCINLHIFFCEPRQKSSSLRTNVCMLHRSSTTSQVIQISSSRKLSCTLQTTPWRQTRPLRLWFKPRGKLVWSMYRSHNFDRTTCSFRFLNLRLLQTTSSKQKVAQTIA